ncbi:hypothetical protein ACFL6U_15705 [Planctomycetota bacterium]
MNALQEQHVTLERNVGINTETMASVMVQLEELKEQKVEMKNILDGFHKTQQQIISRQDILQQYAETDSAQTDDITNKIEALSQEINTLSTELNNKHERMAANYSSLSDAQDNVLQVVQQLQDSSETQQDKIEEITTAWTATLPPIQENIKHLTANYSSLSDTQDNVLQVVQQLQDSSETQQGKIEEITTTWTAKLTPIQENVEHIAASYINLSETQETVLESVQELYDSSKVQQEALVSLKTEQSSISELISEDQEKMGALALTCQTLTDSLNNIKELDDSRHLEVQSIATKLDQTTATLTATITPIQENVEQLAALVEKNQMSQTDVEKATLKRSDDLQRRIEELQAQYTQWQTALTALQQETSLLQSSTASLDNRMTKAIEQKEME